MLGALLFIYMYFYSYPLVYPPSSADKNKQIYLITGWAVWNANSQPSRDNPSTGLWAMMPPKLSLDILDAFKTGEQNKQEGTDEMIMSGKALCYSVCTQLFLTRHITTFWKHKQGPVPWHWVWSIWISRRPCSCCFFASVWWASLSGDAVNWTSCSGQLDRQPLAIAFF